MSCNQISSVSSDSSPLSSSSSSPSSPPKVIPSSPFLLLLLLVSLASIPAILPQTMVVPSFFSANVHDSIPLPSTSPSPARDELEAAKPFPAGG